MDVHNVHPYGQGIGLETIDTNVDHTQWPCVSQPPTVLCADAVRSASRRSVHTLRPAPAQLPAREWVGG